MTSLEASHSGTDEALKAVKYEETKFGKPPIAVAVATPPSSSTASPSVSFARPPSPPQSRSPALRPASRLTGDKRRDSGIAPTSSTARSTSPSDRAADDEGHSPETTFSGITTDIPTDSFMGLVGKQLSFSNRGSMLIDGKKITDLGASIGNSQETSKTARGGTVSGSRSASGAGRVLSADEDVLSHRVRSMYEHGAAEMEDSKLNHASHAVKEFERAGGIEDWEDVDGKDVDRYGFIARPRLGSSGYGSTKTDRLVNPEPQRPQRVSTVLFSASQQPRKRSSLYRSSSKAGTARSSIIRGPSRRTSKQSLKPSSSMDSVHSAMSFERSRRPFRSAANRLPYNKNRRWMDEAGDMLTLPPGLADIAETEEGGKSGVDLKKKERHREDKWRRMARVVTKEKRTGGGMEFEFDTRDPKLISRTWKGIPDSWRAAAWHAFLTASAKRAKNSPSDEELTTTFHELQEESCADDVQIDIDVPRTINSHIMFRRRYAGGQRLLFRVLHALSLYFPDIGYVQGMASLAATLLCYYDEETAFVMMVRLWDLRGLKQLYQSGFEGLMEALNEFEQKWLAGGDVATKLNDLGITSTAYGTRWYLTLFNYSIPFPAQLRVWDVFMLLGDHDAVSVNPRGAGIGSFAGCLDVLHATSAALIDGMREILLDSDFENAMKVLTSWIPIRDEELLMKVAKAEWKQKRRKPRG